jgi:hypothetical protein
MHQGRHRLRRFLLVLIQCLEVTADSYRVLWLVTLVLVAREVYSGYRGNAAGQSTAAPVAQKDLQLDQRPSMTEPEV